MFRLYGNGVHYTVCGEGWVTLSFKVGSWENTCTYTSFYISMSIRVGGFLKKMLKRIFYSEHLKEVGGKKATQDPVFLQHPVHMSSHYIEDCYRLMLKLESLHVHISSSSRCNLEESTAKVRPTLYLYF